MQDKNFIVYRGEEFTVEWYFSKQNKSPALEYFTDLTTVQKNKFFYLIQRIADTGKILNKEKFNYEGDQIFALKPAPDRFLCFFFDGSKIIITNAYKKQTQKMPIREKERSLKAKEDYTKRVKTGDYYDQIKK